MGQLTIEIIGGVVAGVVVTLFSAYLGALVNRRYFQAPILAGRRRAIPKSTYARLNGSWFEYHITRDSLVDPKQPFWLKDKWSLTVRRGYLIDGTLELIHPKETVMYKLVGEIRGGRMVLTGTSVEESSEFFTVIFPNLLKLLRARVLVGILIGFDWNNDIFSAPIILTRSEIDVPQLNKILAAHELTSFLGEKDVDQQFLTSEEATLGGTTLAENMGSTG